MSEPKIDNSLFEDVPFSENKSVDNSLFEDVPHPEAVSPSSPSEAKTVGGGIIGGGAGFLLGKQANKVADSLLPYIGPLDKTQIDHLKNTTPDKYRATPHLEDLLDQWKNMAKGIQQTGIDSAAEARKSLEGLPGIHTSKFYDAFGNEAANPAYSTPIEKGTKAKVLDKHFSEIKPEIDNLRNRKNEIDSTISQLEAQKNVPVSDSGINLREKHANQNYDRKMSNPNNTNQSDLNFKKYQSDEKFDLAKSKKEQQELNKLEKQMEQLSKEREGVLNRIGDKSKTATQAARKEYSKISNIPEEVSPPEDRFLRKEYSNQLNSAVDRIRPAGDGVIEPKTADQIIQELRNGVDYEGQPDQVKKFNKNLAEDTRRQVLNKEEFPEYNKFMDRSSKAQNAQDAISDLTGVKYDKSPENISFSDSDRNKVIKMLDNPASANREDLIKSLTKAENAGVLPAGSIKNFFETGDLSRIKNIVSESSKINGATLGRVGKGLTKAGVGAVVGEGLGGHTGAVVGGGLGALSELYGGKLQELAALNKNSKLLNNFLPGALGAAGAGIGAMAAANAGELSPEAATIAGTAEALNPVPMTDIVQGAVEAKKAGQEAQSNIGNRDPKFEAEIAQYGDLGANPAHTLMTANPIEAAKQGGFLKGLTSPIPELAKAAGSTLDTLGTEKSNDARAVMDKRYNTLQSTLQNTPEEFKNGFAYKQAESEFNNMNNRHTAIDSFMKGRKSKSELVDDNKALKQATPDQLMELSKSFTNIKGANNFVAPLENAAQASSPEERQARLFGLYQQPAFRQLLNKGKKQSEEN